MSDQLVNDVEEIWKDIPDYPKYAISNMGQVMNVRTEKLLKNQLTPQGVVYVPLYDNDDNNSTRSVKVLVAKAFVEGETDIFNTPINLDGDKTNNCATNLVWRPLWFAVSYSRQFVVDYAHKDVGPVYEVETNTRYDNVYIVGTTFGVLFKEVYRSVYAETPVFPTKQRFRIPNPKHVR